MWAFMAYFGIVLVGWLLSQGLFLAKLVLGASLATINRVRPHINRGHPILVSHHSLIITCEEFGCLRGFWPS